MSRSQVLDLTDVPATASGENTTIGDDMHKYDDPPAEETAATEAPAATAEETAEASTEAPGATEGE